MAELRSLSRVTARTSLWMLSEVPQPAPVLDYQGTVEAQLMAQGILGLLRRFPAKDHGGHVTRQDVSGCEDQHAGEQQGEDDETQTAEDEAGHGRVASPAGPAPAGPASAGPAPAGPEPAGSAPAGAITSASAGAPLACSRVSVSRGMWQ